MSELNFLINLHVPLEKLRNGGLIALHKLAYELARRNHLVYIFTDPYYPHPNISTLKSTPIKPGTISNNAPFYQYELPDIDPQKTVTIYPEIQNHNPYNFPHVTRWILYHTYKRPRIEDTWGENDILFNFGNFETIKPCRGILRVVDYNFEQLYDEQKPREGFCHIIHKETPSNFEEILGPFKSHDLTGWESQGYEFLRGELNKYEYLLLFDSKTFNALAALLCGCKVIILNVGANKIPQQYYSENPEVKYGLAYGLSELSHANQTIHLARSNIVELSKRETRTVDNFIEFWKERILGIV